MEVYHQSGIKLRPPSPPSLLQKLLSLFLKRNKKDSINLEEITGKIISCQVYRTKVEDFFNPYCREAFNTHPTRISVFSTHKLIAEDGKVYLLSIAPSGRAIDLYEERKERIDLYNEGPPVFMYMSLHSSRTHKCLSSWEWWMGNFEEKEVV
tara:strand:- start:1919 stop:2374 length:456 start_codon:yes stop_codon:yes gene_type:complete